MKLKTMTVILILMYGITFKGGIYEEGGGNKKDEKPNLCSCKCGTQHHLKNLLLVSTEVFMRFYS